MTEPVLSPQKPEDPEWLQETLHKRVVYATPGMDQVRVEKDLTYKRAPERELKADVYMPPTPSGNARHPGVVFVHGGYLPPNLRTEPKDWGIFVSYGQLVASSGFIGIPFNHRYYGPEYLETAQSDIRDLLSYIREHAGRFGLDRDRISLWAFSGGGPLVSWALREAPPYIHALVLYYTMLDTNPRPQSTPAAIADETLAEFSAVTQVENSDGEIFPIFLARAGLDRPALNETIDRFVQVALSKNVPLDVSNHARGHHGFDLLDDDTKSRQIIQRTINFLKALG